MEERHRLDRDDGYGEEYGFEGGKKFCSPTKQQVSMLDAVRFPVYQKTPLNRCLSDSNMNKYLSGISHEERKMLSSTDITAVNSGCGAAVDGNALQLEVDKNDNQTFNQMCSTGKLYKSEIKDAGKDPLRHSCFELYLNFDVYDPSIDEHKDSKRSLPIESNRNVGQINKELGDKAQKLVAVPSGNLHDESCAELSEIDSLEDNANPPREDGLVCKNAGEYTEQRLHTTYVDDGLLESKAIENESISLSDAKNVEILRPASEHQNIPLVSCEQSLDPYLPSLYSSNNLNGSAPWIRKKAPVICMGSEFGFAQTQNGFAQTQIGQKEFSERKTLSEPNAKVVLPVDEPKKRTFITQRTVVFPKRRLEMQCSPNGIYHYKYKNVSDVKDFSVQAVTSSRDQYSQTKQSIVTQSQEDTNRAISVLNVMLQRRLNNSGSQNESLQQNSFSLTPREDPKSPSTKITSYKTGETNKNAEMLIKRENECVEQKSKCFLKQLDIDETDGKKSRISSADGRSTIRDRLPRGQTRKLASLFETMSDAASEEMLREMNHLKRRGKSVPPDVEKAQTEVSTRTATQDDSDLFFASRMDNNMGGGEISLGFPVPLENTGHEGTLWRDKHIVEASKVRNIVDRFESISSPEKYGYLRTNMPIDSTPRRVLKKRYPHYEADVLKLIPDAINCKNLQNVSCAIGNVNSNGAIKSSAAHPNERIERAVCGDNMNLSSKLSYDNAGYTGVWDQQQYELGLHKGMMDLKRYDGNNNKAQKEISDGCPRFATQMRNYHHHYHSETLPSYQKGFISNRPQQNYYEKMDADIVDHVAEVEKAFDFVNKTESMTTAGPQCSQESLGKPTLSTAKASFTTSLNRDLELEGHNSVIHDVPVRFSPAAFSSPPCAGERVATYDHTAGIECVTHENQMVKSDPIATSTPLDGSPAISNRVHTSVSNRLNRSGISTITASTGHEMTQIQQNELKLQALKEAIMVQEDQIAQATSALTHCKKNYISNRSLAELTAQRGLLLARERLLAFQNEMQRLKTLQLVKKPMHPLAKRMRGSIDLTSINVYLNRNFCVRNTDENVSYAFVILLKTDEQVEATQTITLMDTRALRVSKVHFPDQIRFTNLPVDFTVLLEIYAMPVIWCRPVIDEHFQKISECRRADDYSCSVLKNKAKSLLTPSKKSDANVSLVSTSEFTCCGHIFLNRDTVGAQKFYLDGAIYPLEGTIEVDSRCTTLPPVIETVFRGFLTMYQVVSGLGSWARYWAVLRRGMVQFWKYPDDEASGKPALTCMDLSKCTDKEIIHASHEVCLRPNAFTVDLLVPSSPSLLEKKRVLLSADTKEFCNAWLNALNETLEVLRG